MKTATLERNGISKEVVALVSRAIALLSAFAEDQLRPVAVTQTSPELTFA